MEKQVIYAAGVDPAKVPYSSAVKAGGMVYLSGQAGLVNGKAVGDDIVSQARQAMENLGKALEAAGTSWEKVVKVNCFMTDPEGDFDGWNKVFREYFPENPPARSTVGTHKLIGPSWVIEIDIIALA